MITYIPGGRELPGAAVGVGRRAQTSYLSTVECPVAPARHSRVQRDIRGEPVTDPQPPDYAGHVAPDPGYGPNPTAQGVRGYRDLTAEEIDLINQLKAMQEAVAGMWASVFLRDGVDRRKANIAKTHFEEGFSALVGSVARPHDPFLAALVALDRRAARSTTDANLAQPSQDHRPDEGSRA